MLYLKKYGFPVGTTALQVGIQWSSWKQLTHRMQDPVYTSDDSSIGYIYYDDDDDDDDE